MKPSLHRFIRTPVLLLLAVGSGAAFAQQDVAAAGDDGVQALPTVTVYGHASAVPVEAARKSIEQTPGGVAVIDADDWRDTPARTLKDMLDYTPGVFAQPKWGEDTRLSIRGSSLSRNFHLRGVQLYQDGVPLNAADGSADFQEIDPSALRYTEVYKGGNGLRYGANSLGGAINFVTRTAADSDAVQMRSDAGSFDYYRQQLGGGLQRGAVDAYLSGSWLKLGGYRDHSAGESRRAAGNIGFRLGAGLDTRFYFSGGDIEQEIPGAVTKEQALRDPRKAAGSNIAQDYHRDMRTWRVANKTTFAQDGWRIEAGVSAAEKQLIHPIFQFLDYEYHDFAGFGRVVLDRALGGLDNRFTLGAQLLGGWIDNQQFRNLPGGQRGDLLSASRDRSSNTVIYMEDALSLTPRLQLIAAGSYVDATRKRRDHFNAPEKTSGEVDYSFFNPKLGLLWQFTPAAQAFANVSRSGEAPTFGELNFTNAALAETKAQRATTVEIGTRGEQGALHWDLAIYRATLDHEFQYFDLGGGNYAVTNADKTIHQGVELGVGGDLLSALFTDGDMLSLELVWTYNDFRFDDDAVWGHHDLPGAPRQYWRSELLYRHPAGFYAGPNVEWVPQGYFVDNANSLRTDAYALLGLRAGYDSGRHWSVYIDGRNLADRRYIASSSVTGVATPASMLFEPGTGINVSAGVNLRW